MRLGIHASSRDNAVGRVGQLVELHRGLAVGIRSLDQIVLKCSFTVLWFFANMIIGNRIANVALKALLRKKTNHPPRSWRRTRSQ